MRVAIEIYTDLRVSTVISWTTLQHSSSATLSTVQESIQTCIRKVKRTLIKYIVAFLLLSLHRKGWLSEFKQSTIWRHVIHTLEFTTLQFCRHKREPHRPSLTVLRFIIIIYISHFNTTLTSLLSDKTSSIQAS